MNSIGERLKTLQDRAGLKAVEVCEKGDIKKNTYSQWINNKREPSIEEVLKLTAIYQPILGDQTLFVLTGKPVTEYIAEVTKEYKNNIVSIDQLSTVLHQSLEDLEELEVIKFPAKSGINQTIKLILNRSKALSSK